MSGVLIVCGTILFLTLIFDLVDDKHSDESWIIGMKIIAISAVLASGIWGMFNHEMDAEPLFTHIDHSKTKTTKENGEVTDLYLTIDGKEYHFEFEEVMEDETKKKD